MRQLTRIVAAGTCAALLLAPLPSLGATPQIIISEIAWAGSAVSNADEWVELQSLSDEPTDISGWTVEGAASGGGTIEIPEGSIIASYDTYLISNYGEENEKTSLGVEADFVTSAVSLSNGALRLVLRDAVGTQIDVAGDAGAPFAGRTSNLGADGGGGAASMIRLSPEDGQLSENWAEAEVSKGFDAEALEQGTPGSADIAPLVEETLEEDPVNDLSEEAIEEEQQDVANDEVEDEIETETEENPPKETNHQPPSPYIFPVGTLVINEVLSGPETNQVEWIEIYNPYTNVIPLEGWRVRDASGVETNLPQQLLGFSQMIVIENPKGKLNNDGDTVELLDPSGHIIDSLIYGSAAVPAPNKGNSLARDEKGNIFETTFPTPGAINEIVKILIPEEEIIETFKEPSLVDLPPTSKTDPTTSTKPDEKPEIEVDLNLNGPTTLLLNELYPNTKGDDAEEEFIEVMNNGKETVRLLGWQIKDAAGKKYSFSDTKLEPDEFLLLLRDTTHISLNNTSETLQLIAPDGTEIDQVTYEKTNTGESLSRFDSQWQWTETLTPNKPNLLATDKNFDPETSTGNGTTSNSTKTANRTSSSRSPVTFNQVTTALAQTLRDDSPVIISGTVLAIPGSLGSRILYLGDETGGIQIYKYDNIFPDLSLGDWVTVTGILSTSHEERRVKLSGEESIVFDDTGSLPVPEARSIDSITASDSGLLIQIEGLLTDKSGRDLILESDGVSIKIRAGVLDRDLSRFPRGTVIKATGIVSPYDGTIRILARTGNDLEIVEEEIIETATLSTAKDEQSSTNQQAGIIIAALATTGLAGLGLRKFIHQMKASYVRNRLDRLATQGSR